MSEERIMEHFKECGPAMENIHATLASALINMKGNTVLRRQIKNMKRRNQFLRKMIRISRLQIRPKK
jgi:hypothetical protein